MTRPRVRPCACTLDENAGRARSPWACVDPAGYRAITSLSGGACDPYEYRGEVWPQELVKWINNPPGGWGCSPVCDGGAL